MADVMVKRSEFGWEPPFTFEEKVKNALISARLYHVFLAHLKLHRGERELKLLPHVMDRRRISIDAGANRGVYTYWMQKYSRHVYAYEPNPKMFKLLKAGVRGNVTVSPIALSNRTMGVELRIPKRRKGYSNQGASLNFEQVGPQYGEVRVEARRLDDENLKDVGFIKIDVEGHEFELLEGARETIKRDKPTLLIEIEERHNKIPIEKSLSRVKDLGYSGFVILDGVLKGIDFFDPEMHHRSTRKRSDYRFNFLFFPTSTSKG